MNDTLRCNGARFMGWEARALYKTRLDNPFKGDTLRACWLKGWEKRDDEYAVAHDTELLRKAEADRNA